MTIAYLYVGLLTKGGADRVLTEKANWLANHGHHVYIITELQLGRTPIFPLSPKVMLIDIGIDFGKQYQYNIFRRGIFYLNCIRKYKQKLSKILNDIHPDVVITTLGRDLGCLSSIHDDSIKIGEAHTTKDHIRSFHLLEQKGIFYRLLVKYWRKRQEKAVSQLKALVLLTKDDAKSWEGIAQTYVIPNSLPFYPEKGSTCENKQAIIVGRYNDAKGYNYLVEAWLIVNKKHPDWKINIYGSGEMHDDVNDNINKHGLQEVMIMHDPISEIKEKYLESSIYIMSSVYEGFPMVILEAMACGLPVVSFDCPHGPRNIIKNNEDGFLVEPRNTQALAEKICILIENEKLRKQYGAKARENILRFAPDTVMKNWEELFSKLVNEKTIQQ
jgi:glycosyltransferase involved in cell wall biosynthesis